MEDAAIDIAFTWANAAKLILCTLAGSTVTGLCGFGAVVLALPLMAAFFPVRAAVVVMTFSPLVNMGFLAWKLRRDVDWRPTVVLCAAGAVGVVAGARILADAPAKLLLIALGAIVVAVAIINVAWAGRSGPAFSTRWGATGGVGLFAGILSGAYGVPGPPLVIYAYSTHWAPHVAKAVCAVYFLVTNAMRVPVYVTSGFLTRNILIWNLILIPCGLVGVTIGHAFANRINAGTFKRIVYVVLALSGVMLVIKGITHAG